MKNIIKNLIIFCFAFSTNILSARSPLRTQEKWVPTITATWADSAHSQCYTLKHASLEAYPLFEVFDKNYFEDHTLPDAAISLSNNIPETVDGSHLKQLLEHLMTEIKQKKHHFTHFKILQRKNWNRRHTSGLLVLKFKNYPFVVKLFSENPQTFVDYWDKGFEPIFFFYMGHGANRHISGLTRIKNKELVEQRLAKHPQWGTILRIPRKWHWQPNNNRYIKLTGNNLGNGNAITTELPSIYAIIADAEETDDNIKVPLKQKRRMVMKLCSQVDLTIDPHYNNFVFQQDPKTGKLSIVLIDTEYFPIIIGMRETKEFKTHGEWYLYMVNKFVNDTYLRDKKQRQFARFEPHNLKVPVMH